MTSRKSFKRLGSLFLILSIILSVFSFSDIAFAEEEKISVNLEIVGLDKELILDEKDLSIDPNSSAEDLIREVLDAKEISYKIIEGDYGSYLSEINGLKEKDHGPTSGWLYKLNGQMPDQSIDKAVLEDKMTLKLYYLRSWEEDKAKLTVEDHRGNIILDSWFMEIVEGETGLDFFKRVLEGENIDYKLEDSQYGSYVTEIAGLAQFDQGKNSGWIYKVNKKNAESSLDALKLEGNTSLHFSFIKDWTNMPEEGEFFSDLKGFDWARSAINTLASDRVLKGRDQFKFVPSGHVTRAEFASMVARHLKLEELGDKSFDDVKKGSWYYEDVLKLANKGYIKGRTAKRYYPDEKISRQEMAVIVGNILKDRDYELKGKNHLDAFKDKKEVGAWAEEAFEYALDSKIFIGSSNGRLLPREEANRGQAALIVYRLGRLR